MPEVIRIIRHGNFGATEEAGNIKVARDAGRLLPGKTVSIVSIVRTVVLQGVAADDGWIGDRQRIVTRLEVLRDLEPVDASARLTMSASSAAPVSSAETTVKTVTEPTVEAVNKAGVETSDELMVKMRKPLRYYDRRPEPE